jgi:hypothetical protein
MACKTMISYASDKENVALEDQFLALSTKLARAKESEFGMKCGNILTEANVKRGKTTNLNILI